jgi:hypothetical protein
MYILSFNQHFPGAAPEFGLDNIWTTTGTLIEFADLFAASPRDNQPGCRHHPKGSRNGYDGKPGEKINGR